MNPVVLITGASSGFGLATAKHLAAHGAHVGQLAYMLRCFFDGCRRAIAFKECLIALAERPAAMTG